MQEKTTPSFVLILIIVIILEMVARSMGPVFTRASSGRTVYGLIDRLV